MGKTATDNQQIKVQEFLNAHGVQIESWGPFAEGRNNIFQNDLLVSMALKHERSVAQIILRWLTQRGVVVIPKSVNKDRIIQNFNVFDFELSTDDLALIASLDMNVSSFFDHRDPEMVKWISSRKLED